MTKRWKNRIQILVNRPGTYDAWGHFSSESWEKTNEVWANVRPHLNSRSTACVTVRSPFECTENMRIQWNNQLWKPVNTPVYFQDSQLVQFNIEPL